MSVSPWVHAGGAPSARVRMMPTVLIVVVFMSSLSIRFVVAGARVVHPVVVFVRRSGYLDIQR